jgi:acyl-CoA synthetase (NDP forming)
MLLRPFQRWLEHQLRRFLPRHRSPPPPIDVTDFSSERSRRKDNHYS